MGVEIELNSLMDRGVPFFSEDPLVSQTDLYYYIKFFRSSSSTTRSDEGHHTKG